MADAPSPSTEAEQQSPPGPRSASQGSASPSAASQGTPAQGADLPAGTAPSAASPDAGAILAAEFRELQTRYDELLRRFLEQVERRQVLDKALYAERLKAAALKRDLVVFQRQWQIAQKEWHFAQNRWRTTQAEAKARFDEVEGQLAGANTELAELKALLARAEAERDQLRRLVSDMRHSRVWQIGQLYWNVAGKLKRR